MLTLGRTLEPPFRNVQAQRSDRLCISDWNNNGNFGHEKVGGHLVWLD